MSSDERYLYHQPGINTNYGYSSYPPHPPPSYDNQPVVHPPLRPMRSSSSSQSQPHSPPQPPSSHYQPPPTSYPPNYGQGHYMPQHVPNQPPPQPPQWPNENWHYNQSYPPPLPHPPHPSSVEPPFNSGPGRPEPMHSSPMEPPRGYSNAPPSNVDSHRIDDRQSSSLAPPPPLSSTQPQPSSQAKSRRREKESPPAITNSGPSTGLDFIKLLESYRTIIDGSEMFIGGPGMPSAQSRPAPSAETMERMLQSATYGAQVLEAASMQNSVPVAESKSPKEKETDESKDSANGSSASTKRQKPDDTVQEGQTCLGCGATSTPEWRRGPMGPRTLCNACGLVYAKLIKKRVREKFGSQKKTNGQGGTSSQGQGEESGEGDSDDDDEYGSQDRRSEGVDMGRD